MQTHMKGYGVCGRFLLSQHHFPCDSNTDITHSSENVQQVVKWNQLVTKGNDY